MLICTQLKQNVVSTDYYDTFFVLTPNRYLAKKSLFRMMLLIAKQIAMIAIANVLDNRNSIKTLLLLIKVGFKKRILGKKK